MSPDFDRPLKDIDTDTRNKGFWHLSMFNEGSVSDENPLGWIFWSIEEMNTGYRITEVASILHKS